MAIKAADSEFFSSTFNAGPTSIEEKLFDCNYPTISSQHNQQLLAHSDFDEVKKAVFFLDNLSAPGPDGFSGCFYTSCWDIVGQIWLQ